jgi:cytoskeletal protein CcmA (bactofilin family)
MKHTRTQEMRMFRRREDGTEELITETGNASEGAKIVSAAPSAPVASAPLSPSIPNPSAGQPSASFRPVPPQAAMAASRSSMPPQQPAQPSIASSEPARAAAVPTARPNAKRVLTVGPDIHMKGEISSCDRVVIEGIVDASMRDVHTVELTETGTLKGVAEVEDAEISGAFEGDLTVRGKLTLYASGRVRGNVTYGEIEIQRGGQISGNIRNLADAKAEVSHGKKHAA